MLAPMMNSMCQELGWALVKMRWKGHECCHLEFIWKTDNQGLAGGLWRRWCSFSHTFYFMPISSATLCSCPMSAVQGYHHADTPICPSTKASSTYLPSPTCPLVSFSRSPGKSWRTSQVKDAQGTRSRCEMECVLCFCAGEEKEHLPT